MFPKTFSAHRKTLEQLALEAICVCFYYDFADYIDEMSNEELEQIIKDDGVDCPNCNP